jgi:hypothetical protein
MSLTALLSLISSSAKTEQRMPHDTAIPAPIELSQQDISGLVELSGALSPVCDAIFKGWYQLR